MIFGSWDHSRLRGIQKGSSYTAMDTRHVEASSAKPFYGCLQGSTEHTKPCIDLHPKPPNPKLCDSFPE